MFAYIKLVDEDKYDTIPFTWVKNYDQVKLPVNKNKQHYILYENQSPKKALLLFVEDTIDALEKQIKTRRVAVPAPRNQETASELSDPNESSARKKTTPNFDINPVVNQQLEQLKAKLAAIDQETEIHGNNNKENLKSILNQRSKDHENFSKEETTSPKKLSKEEFDLSSVKIEKKPKKTKKRKADSKLLMETKPKKKIRKNRNDNKSQEIKKSTDPDKLENSIREKTTSYSSHDSDSGLEQNDGSAESKETKISKRTEDDKSITVTKSDALDILPDGTANQNRVNTNEHQNKILEENNSQQLLQMEISRSDKVDRTLSGIVGTSNLAEQRSLPEDLNTNILSDINQYLESETTKAIMEKTIIEKCDAQQDNIPSQPSCSFGQGVNKSLKKKKKSKLSKKKHKHGKNLKTKKKTQRDESENDVLKEISQQWNDMKKGQEAFQQVVTAALQTILSNWQQIQSTRATIPTAVQAIDFENIQVPPPVGFIRSDTGMIHCGQNVWITVQDYNNAKAAAGTDAIFVKNIAVDIFTRDVLKNSSITGKSSNRTKAPAKPKLDPVKMLAVRDIYRHYLKEHRQLSEKQINAKVDDYAEYIRGKISDLERPKKIPPKKTEGKSDKVVKESNGTMKKGKGMKQIEVSSSGDSSSANSSSGEESTNSESETSSDKNGDN
ncbi:uncharacterized protein LOC130677691 isoform X3 [Microplitis mediator]|uniref:uncharacterized protein LOC130677691 isoform X3 n=1 Tax=Microplitis mediator TaxID=375433 RepID=UPI00255724B4|nr:uncharacterized protein LOC130677691 isoform X3 [Microplitis mediator]